MLGVIGLVFLGVIASASLPLPPTLDVTAFGARPDSGEDATVPFQRAVEAARAIGGPAVLHIPRGRYDFFPTHAARRTLYYSNATEDGADAIRTVALELTNLRGLSVVGEGARLVMRGKMTMLAAQGCRDLSLRGLEFDFARPTVSEITAVEKGDGYWVGRVHQDSWYRLEGRRLEWLGEGWEAFHNLVQHFDPLHGTTWRGADPTAGARSVQDVGSRLLRFEVGESSLREVVLGRVYQFRDVARDEAGMWFDRCRNVSLEGVKVRAMAGFGMLFQFTRDVSLRHLAVAPDPASGRTCASAADILHFSGCRGNVRVLDSTLSAAHDDAINVHGTHLRAVAREGERKLRMRFMHGQTWGFAAFAPGDEVEFVRRDTLLPYAKAKVRALETTTNPREQILTLDRPLPTGLTLDSDVLENVTWTPSVEVRGCQISAVPTRGILVTTRRPVRIVGNRFVRIPMPSIEVADDARSWYESGPVRDLLVQGNTFVECSGPAVQVDPQNAIEAGPVHHNVRVERNEFSGCKLPIVSARSLDGLIVVGNHLRLDHPVAASDLVQAAHCLNLQVGHNAIEIRGADGKAHG